MGTAIDLGTIGSRGFAIIGESSTDFAGRSVSGAGDVNGDGYDDLIVAAPWAAAAYQGRSYVVYGGSGSGGTVDLSQLPSTAGFRIGGTGYGALSVSNAGDVNGDGFDDLLIGSALGGYYYDGAARAYVVFGRSTGTTEINLAQLQPADGFVINGPDGSGSERLSVSNAGDVNGDGFDDIVIGVTNSSPGGSAFLIFGKAGGFGTIDLSVPSATDGRINGAAPADSLGQSVSSAGDINGDGYDDLIVGAPQADLGGIGAGQAYVIFGKATAFGTIDVSTMPAGTGFMIQGDMGGDEAGAQVSAAGDVNGDGYDDLIIGAPGGDDGGAGAGEAYVLFGHSGGFTNIDLTNIAPGAGFIIQGDAAGEGAGFSVSRAGDFNGDGYEDLIVGAPFADDGGGRAYLIFGHAGQFTNLDLGNLTPSSGFIIRGGNAGDEAGISVSTAGDVNHDGYGDLIVGAPFADSHGDAAGAGYVIFGRNGFSIDANNDVNGDGRTDFIVRDSVSGWLTNWVGTGTGGFANNGSNASIEFASEWKVGGLGDFNGDGRDDFLLRRDDGWLTNWIGTRSGGYANNGANSSQFLTTDWKVIGTGDFNGDGRSDLLLRRDDGWLTDWLGTANGGFTNNGANTSLFFTADWKVVSTGDFNGDGLTDLLFRRDDGWLTSWLGTTTGGFTNNGANSTNFLTTDWKVVGTGDINGDGRDDLLLRRDDGWLTDWLGTANGGFANNGANTSLVFTTDWKIAGIGDIDGNGREDILIRRDDGWMTSWLGTSNGAFANNSANFSAFIANNWQVQDPFL